jgi:RNA polymerase sigma-70 factor (ECF subfamily)
MNPADQFELIVCEHYESLFRFAMSLTRAESDAWALTQQTFYVWATKGHQLRDISKLKTWLFTTLHRAFLEARRRPTNFPHYELEEVSEQLLSSCPQLGDEVDSSQILSALARVDEVYQAAVALFYREDCAYLEIAKILQVPVGTVKSRIARGIRQLREILGVTKPKRDSGLGSGRSTADEAEGDGAGGAPWRSFTAGAQKTCVASSGALVPAPVSDSPGTRPTIRPANGCRRYLPQALEEFRHARPTNRAG